MLSTGDVWSSRMVGGDLDMTSDGMVAGVFNITFLEEGEIWIDLESLSSSGIQFGELGLILKVFDLENGSILSSLSIRWLF